ncbi:MAG: thymidylate synthase [Acidiferrobacterales bacterium]
MQQYLDLCRRVVDDGVWVTNQRTGKRCRTVINADLTYDVSEGALPVLTTKKLAWKSAIAEMLGYLRGYDNAAQFRALGTKTWDANADENEAWLANPFRKGPGDMGRAYGVQGRAWRNPEGKPIDQLAKIIHDLCQHRDDRREILTFWNPGEMDRMCLPACVHTHTFSVLEDRLYLTSTQRSDDLPLGHGFNQVQIGWLLRVVAQIAGLKPAQAFHKIVNAHIYENQMDLMVAVQLPRAPFPLPTLRINPDIRTLNDLETWVTLEDFELDGYQHHPAIKYPFST